MSLLFPEPLKRQEVASSWPERKYSEKLENIRVVWRVLVQWYIFFWTINIAVLQLSYQRLSSDGSDVIDMFVSALFVVLNILGLGACLVARSAMNRSNSQALELGRTIDGTVDQPFDARVINYTTIACSLSLVLNCALWALIATASFYGREASSAVARQYLPLAAPSSSLPRPASITGTPGRSPP